MNKTRAFGLITAVLCVAFLISAVSNAAAGTVIQVNSFGDPSGASCPGNPCSLREALANAPNIDASTIILPAGTYTLNPSAGPLTDASTFPLTVEGAGASSTIINATGASQALDVSSGSLTLDDLTIENAQGAVNGAGLEVDAGASATLNRDTVQDNTASQDGGGLYAIGNLTLNNDLIQDNTVQKYNGGGLYVFGAAGDTNSVVISNSTFANNQAAFGGGIDEDLNDLSSGTTSLAITDSAIVDNQAGASGGGFKGDSYEDHASVTMADTTVADNTAEEGGGLYIGDANATELFSDDTIAANSADAGGDVYMGGSIDSSFEDSIVADGGAAQGPDCAGATTSIISLGHNLDDANACDFTSTGDLVNTNPQLGSLQNNGGPTDTLALTLGSPAINAGGSTCHSSDQRGMSAPQGGACDIGAYESAPPVITSPASSGVSASAATVTAGVANPDLAGASVAIDYGTSAGSYPSATSTQAAAAQSPATSYAFTLSGLQAATTYHYVVAVTTSHGTLTSSDQTFTTAAAPATPAPSGSGTATTTTPPTNTPTTPSPSPSHAFTLTKLRVSPAGELSAVLGAPDAGTFRATATFSVTRSVRVHKHGKTVTEHKRTTYRYGTATLRSTQKSVKALGIGLSRAAKLELAKLHSAKVTLAVTFTPVGGSAATKRATITVTRSRAGRYS